MACILVMMVAFLWAIPVLLSLEPKEVFVVLIERVLFVVLYYDLWCCRNQNYILWKILINPTWTRLGIYTLEFRLAMRISFGQVVFIHKGTIQVIIAFVLFVVLLLLFVFSERTEITLSLYIVSKNLYIHRFYFLRGSIELFAPASLRSM